MKKVLLTCPEMIPTKYVDELSSLFDIKFGGCELLEVDLIIALRQCQGVIIGGNERYFLSVLKGLDLKWIIFIGIQPETFFSVEALEYCKIHSIPIYTTGGGGKAVALTTCGEIEVFNTIRLQNLAAKNFQFPRSAREILAEQTVAIIGAGDIGQAVMKGLKDKVGKIIYSGGRGEKEELKELGFKFELSLPDAFNADIVTIHLSVVPGATEKIIGFAELNRVRQNGLVINNARAELFDERGLLKFLEERPDALCIFDAFWKEANFSGLAFEKSIYSRIARMPNFIFTGHSAAKRTETFEEYGQGLMKVVKENNLAG